MAAGKKVPLRKCIGCGEMKSKKEMIRIIKTTENTIILDKTGKQNGRGAYICPDLKCLETARKSRGLERALKTAIPAEVYEQLSNQISE